MHGHLLVHVGDQPAFTCQILQAIKQPFAPEYDVVTISSVISEGAHLVPGRALTAPVAKKCKGLELRATSPSTV